MLWLTHYINFTQTTQLAAAPSPAIAVDSIVFVGSFRLILYTNSLRQNRNRNRNRNHLKSYDLEKQEHQTLAFPPPTHYGFVLQQAEEEDANKVF